MGITAHCLVKNEEYCIRFAILSVISSVDVVMVFDTGSTDSTVSVITELMAQFPGKIVFEQKGEADHERHTALRQEMIDRTTTDWFMILDGDEIWTKRGMDEAVSRIQSDGAINCLIAPFYLCVGDVYHYSTRGAYDIRGQSMHATPRFFRRLPGIHWQGKYNHDAIETSSGVRVFETEAVEFLRERFWHLSHLRRSSADDQVYSSGGTRARKRRLTYLLIGKRVVEAIPEVFCDEDALIAAPLPFIRSCINFFEYAVARVVEP